MALTRREFLYAAPSLGVLSSLGLTYGQDLALSVRDNGQGIDSEVAALGKEEHFGLQGMRERAARVGGQFRIITSRSTGTTIELSVPGTIAFRHKQQRPSPVC